MCHGDNEKRKTSNDGSNRTTKSRKNQIARRNGNLHVLENAGSGHNQTCGDERKNKKEKLRQSRKLHVLYNYGMIF